MKWGYATGRFEMSATGPGAGNTRRVYRFSSHAKRVRRSMAHRCPGNLHPAWLPGWDVLHRIGPARPGGRIAGLCRIH